MRKRTRLAVAVALVAGLIAVDNPGHARAETYPSWEDVAAAQASAASAQIQVDRINNLLAGLQSTAATAADEAIARAADYGEAQAALHSAARAEAGLDARAREAAAEATALRRRSGAFASQLNRGGGNVTMRLFVSDGAASADSLLYQLGTLSKLSERSSVLFERARQQSALASSLRDQASAARAERSKRDAESQKAYAAAVRAKTASDAAVAEQQARADTMYAQLAVLKNTNASIERAYAEGVAAREAERRASAGKGGNSGGGTSNGGGSASGNGSGAGGSAPPPGIVVDPAAAQAYAAGQLPAFGWGSEEMGCLLQLWNKESEWRANAYNRSSGAYGIPQALPGSKMAAAGGDWMTNANTQVDWGLAYISGRYKSPCAAWSFHLGHNWY